MLNPLSNAMTEIQDNAWLVVSNRFLTHGECNHLIELGRHQSYKQSADVGQKKLDGYVFILTLLYFQI